MADKLTIKKALEKLNLDLRIPKREKIEIKKDGTELYYCDGYSYPLKWETIEQKKIPQNQVYEAVNRAEWGKAFKEETERQEAHKRMMQEVQDDLPW